jgi:4-hydroxybenzoate polyprenyltransferase
MRPMLAPTAAADVVAGAAIAGGAPVLHVVYAAVGSACLYAGGMVQNDLVDRGRDAELNPDRVLVRNPELTKPALLVCLLLFAAGLALTTVAGATLPALVTLGLATAYNFGAKRHWPVDALTMGAARWANLGIGFYVAGDAFTAESLTTGLGYLCYIGGITTASTAEDLPEARQRRKWLLMGIAPMLLGLGAFTSLSAAKGWFHLIPFAMVAAIGAHALWAADKAQVRRFVLYSLLLIFVVHATIMWNHGRVWWMLPIAGLAALSLVMLRALKPAPSG